MTREKAGHWHMLPKLGGLLGLVCLVAFLAARSDAQSSETAMTPATSKLPAQDAKSQPSATDESDDGSSATADGDGEGDEEDATTKDATSASGDDESKNGVDLNEIDLEEAPVDWQSSGEYTPADVSSVTRIQDIVEPPSEYHYAAFGKPNPFEQPSLDVAAEESVTEIPMVSELQKYPIDKLKVGGIWRESTGDWRAMVMTPERGGVIAKVGDPIAAGKILTIEKDRLIARQYKIRADGAREYEDVNLYLGPPPEGHGKIRFRPGKDPEFDVTSNPSVDLKEAADMAPAAPAGRNLPMPPPVGPTQTAATPAPPPAVSAAKPSAMPATMPAAMPAQGVPPPPPGEVGPGVAPEGVEPGVPPQ